MYGTKSPSDSPSREVWRRGLASGGALLLALLMGALVYLVAQSNAERDQAAARERHSFEVIMLSRSIEGAISRSEAALGRFVINSDRAIGTIYRDEWRLAGRQIEQLRRLVRDNPEQAASVDSLQAHYRAYGTVLSNTANYAASDRNWEALSLHNTAASDENGPAMTRVLEAIADHERELLGERSSARIEATERSNLLANLMAIAGVILGIAALILAWATIRAFRDRHKADLRASDLEAAVAERTAELQKLNAELRAEAAERAAAEQQLHQVQKMEAVGQLTGGIAHDFNNMLAVVIGGLDLAKRKLGDRAGDAARHIDNAMDGANRAAELTRRLLAFARAEPLLPEGTDPGELIRNMADLLGRTIGEQITVSIRIEDGAWPVWVDPHQLENAVLNLAVNARDAMEGSGDLAIAVRNRTLGRHEIGEAEAGDYLEIAVSDTGCGMTPEVMERALEPFFTTKPVGKGTGLGLSQIFGFARQSGGDIGIESSPGDGTTVSIYLPRFLGERARPRVAGRDTAPPLTLRQHVILIVEDDDRVRRATVDTLEELGHQPIACDNGEEALRILSDNDDIDLLMTDVVMPGMTGPELAERAARMYPALPILFVTGYVGEAGNADRLAGYEVLRKPYTMASLAAIIARTLDEERARPATAE